VRGRPLLLSLLAALCAVAIAAAPGLAPIPDWASEGPRGSIVLLDRDGSRIAEVDPSSQGGPVGANRPYMVGERGPELFVPNVSGRIVPNGTSVGENVTINVHGSADPRLTAWEIIRARRAQTFLAGAA